MKTVDAHDFLSRGDSYLHADQTLAVEQEGRTLGFYVPLPGAADPRFQEAINRLEGSVARVLEETGMNEEELAAWFDLNRPAPIPPFEQAALREHVARR